MNYFIRRYFFGVVLFAILVVSCESQTKIAESQVDDFARQAAFIDTLQYRSFLYFINEINPEKGLVRDRSAEGSPASIAGSGFAIPVWAVGAERGWISRERAVWLTLNTLRFFWKSDQSKSPSATGYQGMYYHFLNMKNGKRTWESELSTIDSGLLIAGAHFARNFYSRNNADEHEIRRLASSLTERVNWDWAVLRNGGRFNNTLSLGWKPEKGFEPVGWVGYNEALIMYIVAAGSGLSGAQKAYRRWLSFYDWREAYPGLELVSFPPMFGHHYSHMFVDFRNLPDSYMREKKLDYFENARRAVQVQRRYAMDNPRQFAGYDSLTWGLTACDGPGSNFNTADHKFKGYTARGTSGPSLIQNDDGTIAPTASAASIVFEPKLVIPAINSLYNRYGQKGLWGKYGFKDAFNPTAKWFGTDYLAIDQAPIVLMIENWRSGFVWKYMMADTVIRKGLAVLGFRKTRDYPFEQAIQKFERQDRKNPPPENAILFVGSSSIVKWKTLAEDMAPLKIINRGFGGSQATQAIHFFERVVKPYNPRAIVFYEGDNDIAVGKSPVDVFMHFKEFARQVKKYMPGTPLYILAIKPSIARQAVWPRMQQTNRLIESFCAATDSLYYVDITKVMLDVKGKIRADIFSADMLHMNAKGYTGWKEIIKPLLLKYVE